MSRWKSPAIAARRANHVAQRADKLRQDRRKTKLLALGTLGLVGCLTLGFVWADYLLMRTQKRRLYSRHQNHVVSTNIPTLPHSNQLTIPKDGEEASR